MKKLTVMVILTSIALTGLAQSTKWTDQDRTFLLENLTRSRDELLQEINGLTEKQWNFKESEERWSIAGVVEHIGIWELLLQREITMALSAGPQPEFASFSRSDTTVQRVIMEEKQHITNEYTVPFTYAQPSGLFTGEQSKALLVKRRDESIEFVRSTKENLRDYYLRKGRGSIHHVYISTFGHMDRHLRQIKKIKAHKDYPKN